jgi:HEAT repeat protein
MRLRIVALCCGVLGLAAWAQDPVKPPTPAERGGSKREPKAPVFSPDPEAEAAKPAGGAPGAAAQEAPETRPAVDPIEELFQKLSKWPARGAREAAEALSGLAEKTEQRLIDGLDHNDWRVQASCAYALGRMGSRRAAPSLVRAIREPTNRQSLSELMLALGRVDPERGPAEILPFLAHASARVRDAALAALPGALDARFLPEIIELYRSVRGAPRAVLLEIFGRVPGAHEHEEIFSALSDPETETAHAAARLLGFRAGEEGLRRLLDAAKEGTMRRSSYAMIALTYAEDRRARWLPADDDALRLRAVRLLQSDDPFYRGAAAVLLANLAYRSEEAQLVELADKYLVPILLDTTAGGVFFSDYGAVEELAFRKLEKLSGEAFGKNAPRWKQWWSRAGATFTARRILRGVTAEELRRCILDLRRASPDGALRSVLFVGDLLPADQAPPRAVVLGAEDCARVFALLQEARFFAGGSDPQDAVAGGFYEIGVTRGPRRFDRRRAGEGAAELRPLAEELFRLDDELAWQRFAPADPEVRLRWLADRRAELAALPPEGRGDFVLGLALVGYANLDREGRAAAVRAAERAPVEWRRRNGAALGGWLRAESTFTEHTAALFRMLGDVPSAEARDEVFAFFAKAPGPRTEEAFAAYLATQDFATCLAALKARHAPTRAYGAKALARFGASAEAAPALIDGLRDAEIRVRDACVAALAAIKDPRTPALVDAVLTGEDRGLRVRAIEALGAVAGDDSVPRLTAIYREGDVHERAAALRALEKAGGKRAQIALAAIAREAADAFTATEAVLALSRIGGDEAAEKIAGLFAQAPLRDVRLQCVSALAAMLGSRAVPVLAPALRDQDPVVRRVAVLALGRVGGREALEPLLKALEAPAGDAAAEDALRRLTFFVSDKRTPRERYLDARAWADQFGAKTRGEWFRAALESARVDAVALDGALGGEPLDATGFFVLVRAVKTGGAGLRDACDALLRAITRLDLPPLAFDASDDVVEARQKRFESWGRENADLLARGVSLPLGFFDPPAAAPAPRAPESAPASRP